MSWKAEYAILILISTMIDYYAGRRMADLKEKIKRRKYLILSLFTNLGLLFAFKYFNFFNDSIRAMLTAISLPVDIPYFNVLLPVGISFYTFQTLSYTIDVYNGKIKPERHFGIFAVYVAFFPQLVAGPIERAKNLLPQFAKKHKFDYKRVTDGLKLMLWGFFLKIVIADRLSIVVDHVYNDVTGFVGVPLIIATYFFAFQIYCDFAGYSFIAIGAAQVLGIKLMDNFRRPYFSKSVSEFWKRWHISLTTWFRDYLYIPLGGNRVVKSRWLFNIAVVFLISGLWHGAGWTFVIWGALHGSYLIFSILTKNVREKFANFIGITKFPRFHMILKVFITFHLVLFGWIFFRANTFSDAIYVITHLFTGLSFHIKNLFLERTIMVEFVVAIPLILFMEFIHLIQERMRMRQFLDDKPLLLRWAIYFVIIMVILLFGIYQETPFIYFQF